MAVKADNTQTQSKRRDSPGVVQDVQKQAQQVEKKAQPLIAFFTKFNNDWVMNLSAALAYNLLTAIFPIAVAILAILGLILGHLSPSSMTNIMASLQNVFPKQISSNTGLFNTITRQLARISGPLGIIALLVAIFGGSRLFTLMEGCFDIIYHVKPRGAIQQNVMAICMLLLFVILIPLMVVASSGPALVFSLLRYTPLAALASAGPVVFLGGILSGLIASFILFLAIYIVVPNKNISFGDSWLGALVAAILLELFLSLFPFYVTHFMTGYVGQVLFAVVLLAFFYYFAVILLLGAEINAFFSARVVATPADLVTMVHDWTSHAPENQEKKEKTAALSHKPINPGSGYTVNPMQETSQLGHQAQSKQGGQAQQPAQLETSEQAIQSTRETDEQAVQTAREVAKHAQQQGKAEKSSSSLVAKAIPIAEAVAGTALAFGVELIRLSRKNKTKKPVA
ncbi:MAG TPA: YihY/virulence factor BrkB family protein [Ktedonobacteraceae bacterium]|nr:YihY/virulence factor BrkB family protein [Ktedonobacteraceae bacterium]